MPEADTESLRQLRELLPATAAGIYLDTATRGPIPAETAAAMREADDWELRVGRVWDGREDDVAQRSDEARAVIAALIGADPADVALTYGREDALNLARYVAADGARILDATQRVGVERLDVGTIEADAVAFAADRWLLGPEATGALWMAGSRAAGLSRALPRTSLIGLARSIGWLEMYVGLEWIYERTAGLAARLRATLSAVPGVDVLTSTDARATISIKMANWSAQQALDELSRRIYALVGKAADENAIVASVAWFNTEDELDRFAQAVADLAAPHTRNNAAPAVSDRVGRLMSQREPVYRPWWEVRWRQLRNPPPPVFRAVVANLLIAVIGGVGLLVYTLSQPVGANLGPAVALFVIGVVVAGSALTYLWVELPTGASGVRRRSPWAAMLGVFAALPIAYLVIIVVLQVLAPALR